MKRFTLTLVLLIIHNLNGQTINDSLFNKVILIKNTDVVSKRNDFLIDIPINPQKQPLVIFNADKRIPTKLFFDRNSFLSEQNELFLITPDYDFQKEIIEEETRRGIEIKAARNKLYHIKRNNTNYKVDSLSIPIFTSKGLVNLNYIKPELQQNELKYYFVDCYGSTCCPADPKWNFLNTLQQRIKVFEDDNNVNVTNDILSLCRGKEGEHCNYYSLADLTNEQKIEFFQIFEAQEFGYSKIYVPIILNKQINK